jgi:hypothetical protein
MVKVMEWKGDFPRIDVLIEKAEGLRIDKSNVYTEPLLNVAQFSSSPNSLLTSRLPVDFGFYFRSACSDRKGVHLVRIVLRILIAVAH